MWLTHLLHMVYLVSDSPVKYITVDKICSYVLSIDRILTDISRRVNKLSQVDLVVLNRNESNQVCPRNHCDVGTKMMVAISAQVTYQVKSWLSRG